MSNKKALVTQKDLYQQITGLIEQSQRHIAIQANSTLTLLFWQIGRLINDDVLGNKRANYAKQIVSTLSTQLKNQYGKNFDEKNVRRMMQFAQQYADKQIVVTLSRQLSWSHFLALIPLKTQEAKAFYAHLASTEVLGVRALREQINRKAYERTAIANTPIVTQNAVPFNAFKDPYLLDFLQLQNTFLEADLEQAILR